MMTTAPTAVAERDTGGVAGAPPTRPGKQNR